ncbi:MAG: YitT family protein [Bacillota bacterium]|uniref:YitT family protein n=1 Tax=unclassified Virgibacillus TaxID=2620237 RepID=UPI0004245688|nr:MULTISPECIES: YitT family protein [Bacillaceae]MCC2251246.1 YitT family protein [Virgibacillus sp. AGTR]MDY7045926.1 YitT family protein [Virgibacillus sp. M23]QRZ17035.1 YitT family protein [Virgibacillus sp. AGTR]
MIFGLKVKNILFILLGSAIFSFGIVHFNMQHNLGEGGFTGITLLLYFLWKWDPAITNIILNIPLFLIGWRFLGRNSFIYSIIGTGAVSLFLSIFQINPFDLHLESDMTLVALFAGVFIGVGLGIIFRFGGTTGGVDIIARLVNKYVGWSMGRTMFLFDFIVIMTSVFAILDLKQGMYTLLAVYIGARVIDFLQEGAYSAKGATIISSQSNDIAAKILKDMDRGVTVLEGRGSFSGDKRDVLYCVVARNEIVRLKNIINSVDPHAFVAVSTVHDVLGEGFTLDENKNPIQE